MDADVITVETARSANELLKSFPTATRGWDEAKLALANMVQAARESRRF